MGVGAAVLLGFGYGSYFTRNKLEQPVIPKIEKAQTQPSNSIEPIESGVIKGFGYTLLRDNISGLRILVIGGYYSSVVLPAAEDPNFVTDELPCQQ